MTPVPRRFSIGRDVVALVDQLRWARLRLTREGRDDDMGWHRVADPGQPAFGSGWAHKGGGYFDLAFARHPVERVLAFRGSFFKSSAVAVGETIFTLPVGYRPAYPVTFPAYVLTSSQSHHVSNFSVEVDGRVRCFVSSSLGTPDHCSFDGMEFLVPDDPGVPG